MAIAPHYAVDTRCTGETLAELIEECGRSRAREAIAPSLLYEHQDYYSEEYELSFCGRYLNIFEIRRMPPRLICRMKDAIYAYADATESERRKTNHELAIALGKWVREHNAKRLKYSTRMDEEKEVFQKAAKNRAMSRDEYRALSRRIELEIFGKDETY